MTADVSQSLEMVRVDARYGASEHADRDTFPTTVQMGGATLIIKEIKCLSLLLIWFRSGTQSELR